MRDDRGERTADWRAGMRAFFQALNGAAGDSARLGELARSPALAALPGAIGGQRAKRPLAFAHGYLLGSLDAAGGALPPGSVADVPACLPASVAASVEAAELPPDPDLVERAVVEMDAALDRDPLLAVASLGRLLGALWWPTSSRPAHEAMPALGGLLRGIRAIDDRKGVDGGVPTVVMTGSGKRRREMPSITTASAIVAAFVLGQEEDEVTLVKPVSGGTSFLRGSSDAVEDLTGRDAFELPVGSARLRVLRCETALPRFARLYHGLTFSATVVSLCAPAVAAAGASPAAVAYGLTDGATDACALTLADAYPGTKIVTVAGRDRAGNPLVDEPSAVGPTEWACAEGDRVQTGTWQETDPLELATQVSSLPDLLTGRGPRVWREMLAKQAALVIALARGDRSVPPEAPDRSEVHEAIGSPEFGDFVAFFSRDQEEGGSRLSLLKRNWEVGMEREKPDGDGEKSKKAMSAAVTQGETGGEEAPKRVSAVVSQGESAADAEKADSAEQEPEDQDS